MGRVICIPLFLEAAGEVCQVLIGFPEYNLIAAGLEEFVKDWERVSSRAREVR